MHGRERARAIGQHLPGAALLHQLEPGAEHVARGDRAQAHHDVGADAGKLAFQPDPAGGLFRRVRAAMQPHLAAALELEVLDRVGDVEAAAVDPQFLQRAIEQLAGRADERASAEVLGVARLLAHHEHARVLRAFAEYRLRRVLPERATPATRGGRTQGGEAVVDRFRRGAFRHRSLAWFARLALLRSIARCGGLAGGHVAIIRIVRARRLKYPRGW
jgi:hypothetical protein